MAIMDIQVSPRREGTISVSDAVVAAHREIEAAGLPCVLHPMGTCVEGEPAALYAVAARIHQALIELGYPRIGISLKIDDRRDKQQSMADKISVVERKMAELDPVDSQQ
jgi:uncharacterized protein (TIGR00106 family)